ncbi:GDSL-type esterase/lipase family protein [Streptomyces sp. NPDC058001]|uniref:GDSL-type esterase/lipase family protein n=1 Tax=Streptomyces sp. NPDC058001 TaxID=3346300 RepID=UPI0036EFF096
MRTGRQLGDRRTASDVFGDSLVDGTGSRPDTDSRFTDMLARRLMAAGRPRAVLKQGLGGSRLTLDSPWLGDRATARFDRDALAQPGVSTVIVLAGINDIAISEMAEESPFPVLAPYTEVPAQQVIAGLRDMIGRAPAVRPNAPRSMPGSASPGSTTPSSTWPRRWAMPST